MNHEFLKISIVLSGIIPSKYINNDINAATTVAETSYTIRMNFLGVICLVALAFSI